MSPPRSTWRWLLAGLTERGSSTGPRLLTDNGSSYVAGDLAEWLEGQGMTHIRGAPGPPQTQGKIERRHQTLRSRTLPEHRHLPGALKQQVGTFIERHAHAHAHARAHESLSTLAPADVCCGHSEAILAEPDRIKRQTLTKRRPNHHAQAASRPQMNQILRP